MASLSKYIENIVISFQNLLVNFPMREKAFSNSMVSAGRSVLVKVIAPCSRLSSSLYITLHVSVGFMFRSSMH